MKVLAKVRYPPFFRAKAREAHGAVGVRRFFLLNISCPSYVPLSTNSSRIASDGLSYINN